jgi:hypothetical protein
MDGLDARLAVLWHLLVAWDLRERGHNDLARDTLIRLARLPVPSFAGWNLDDFVPFFVEAAAVDEESFLRLLATLIPADYPARETVLKRFAERGSWQLAVRGACQNPDEDARLLTFETILAVTPSELSRVIEAIDQKIADIHDWATQARALASVGERRGQLEGRDAVESYFKRARALLVNRARGTIATWAFAVIALREARAGFIAGGPENAREIVERANRLDEDERETWAAGFARILAELGDASAAEAMAEDIKDPAARDSAFADIAAALEARGDAATARAMSARIADPLERVKSFATISKVFGDLQDAVRCRELFEAGYAVAAGLDVDRRFEAMAELLASSQPAVAAAVVVGFDELSPIEAQDAWSCVARAHVRRLTGSTDDAVEALR